MTQEQKELLLIDLCARLPYKVKVAVDFKAYLEWLPNDENLEYHYRRNLNTILDLKQKTIEDISKEPNIIYSYPCTERFQMTNGYTYRENYGVPMKFIKPYLRPMSSMTEEEKEELNGILPYDLSFSITANGELMISNDNAYGIDHSFSWFVDIQNWLNSKQFDYRGLIPMELALEAPEGMYNT